MATVSSLTQYFINGAMEGFVDALVPLNAFSYVVSQQGAVLNDVVRVPFASAGTTSTAFNYTTGYTGNNGSIVGKSVTLGTLLYQPLQLTDAEMSVLNPQIIVRQGVLLGQKLAGDFLSASFAATVNTTNFTKSGSYATAGFTSSLAMADLDYTANTLKWPDKNRSIIAGTSLWQSLMNNSLVQTAYAYGGSEAVRGGNIPSFFGFQPYKTTLSLGATTIKGFACNPNALAIAMAYHKPADQANSILINAQEIRDEKTGLVLGYREWYDPSKATVNKVIDVLGGCAVADSTALLTIA